MTRTQRILLLAAGDAAILILFVAIGQDFHNTAGETPILSLAKGVAPFLLAWFGIAPILHSYSLERLATPFSAVIHTAYTWLAAGILGIFLRSALLNRPPAHWTFVVFTLLLNFIGLVGWRLLYLWLMARRTPQTS